LAQVFTFTFPSVGTGEKKYQISVQIRIFSQVVLEPESQELADRIFKQLIKDGRNFGISIKPSAVSRAYFRSNPAGKYFISFFVVVSNMILGL